MKKKKVKAKPRTKKEVVRPDIEQMPHSDMPPLPYWPNLRLAVPQTTAVMCLTYLEIMHPAPQDTPERLVSLPVEVDLDTMSGALNVHRRTLYRALSVLCTWYRLESDRWSAARAQREFIAPLHTVTGKTKFYSVVGAKSWQHPTRIIVRRNLPFFAESMRKCCIPFPLRALIVDENAPNAPTQQQHSALAKDSQFDETGATPCSLIREPEKLASIMLRASVVGVDRRTVRYPRLKSAVAEKLCDKSVLRARQPLGKRIKGGHVKPERVHVPQIESEAVDPCITEAMARRITGKDAARKVDEMSGW